MPVTPTYPGVYVEEVPSGVRTIVGVATSVAAFIGYFARGPMDLAVQIFNMGDFQREFGGLYRDSEASYAIDQFFKNGGSEAWVVRTAEQNTAQAAAIELQDSASGGTSILLATAANEGNWGVNVRIDVDYATTDPANTFNLVVTELATVAGRLQPVVTETFRNLIIDDTKSNHVIDVVNDGSKLIQLSLVGSPTPGQKPAQTGTISKTLNKPAGGLGDLAGLGGKSMQVNHSNGTSANITLDATDPSTLAELAAQLQTKIRNIHADFLRLTVTINRTSSEDGYLQVKAGSSDPSSIISFTDLGLAPQDLASTIELENAGRTNVQQYALGSNVVAGAQALPGGSLQLGEDGNPPDATALIGSQATKTGMYTLEDVDLFNILCIPSAAELSDTNMQTVYSEALNYCEERRAFLIIDIPEATNNLQDARDWLDDNAILRHRNAAAYFPRPRIPDPLNNYRLKSVGASGTVAGIYARTDATRGVWKAPAGIEAALRNVPDLDYKLTDPENGQLNPLGLNSLRNFDIYGNVCWGSRTLVGADQQASEWKYVPVRRIALFIEESLFRGSQWVVFEPNDEPLWAQIRLNVGAFMHNLFRQGLFRGLRRGTRTL